MTHPVSALTLIRLLVCYITSCPSYLVLEKTFACVSEDYRQRTTIDYRTNRQIVVVSNGCCLYSQPFK